ncbi:uncharacterized protein LOC123204435 [Mangifera indica]|uniref:uncharacterized protein LOC123204435 n=1 Tax=Mangifera indica TaxID=29780 RepID=UPI001CF93890|nr:uncharacterized protein LOC123204435 [Mangifera indica]
MISSEAFVAFIPYYSHSHHTSEFLRFLVYEFAILSVYRHRFSLFFCQRNAAPIFSSKLIKFLNPLLFPYLGLQQKRQWLLQPPNPSLFCLGAWVTAVEVLLQRVCLEILSKKGALILTSTLTLLARLVTMSLLLLKGDLADPRMRAAAKRRGIEITSISRPIKPSDFKDFDLILAMDKQNREDILSAFNRWKFKEPLP